MNRMFYAAARGVGRFIFFCTMRWWAIRPEIPESAVPGAYVLALTHLGHLDPFLISTIVRRPICWMARREMFQFAPVGWLMGQLGAFSVDRRGVPVSSIRRAIALARGGSVVGICPEGGVVRGSRSVLCGGPIRKGACSIAIRAGVPIVPAVLIGSAELSRVGPWLPAKRARIWVAYGAPIIPPTSKSTRETRESLSREVVAGFGTLYAELRREFSLADAARRDEYCEPLLMGRGVG
jgi:1-acyl-sn-glycerol-3-phosphate acyltransferase